MSFRYDIINMDGINTQEDEEGVLASAQCDTAFWLRVASGACWQLQAQSLAVSAGM